MHIGLLVGRGCQGLHGRGGVELVSAAELSGLGLQPLLRRPSASPIYRPKLPSPLCVLSCPPQLCQVHRAQGRHRALEVGGNGHKRGMEEQQENTKRAWRLVSEYGAAFQLPPPYNTHASHSMPPRFTAGTALARARARWSLRSKSAWRSRRAQPAGPCRRPQPSMRARPASAGGASLGWLPRGGLLSSQPLSTHSPLLRPGACTQRPAWQRGVHSMTGGGANSNQLRLPPRPLAPALPACPLPRLRPASSYVKTMRISLHARCVFTPHAFP